MVTITIICGPDIDPEIFPTKKKKNKNKKTIVKGFCRGMNDSMQGCIQISGTPTRSPKQQVHLMLDWPLQTISQIKPIYHLVTPDFKEAIKDQSPVQ
jgi:hypothetical protein